MVYRGRVVKGAILLETGVAFPEGAEIRIEVIAPESVIGKLDEDSAEALEASVRRKQANQLPPS